MPVRIGLIGSGFVSNFYMLGLSDVGGWEIPVVASTSSINAAKFAERWSIPESTDDVHSVIRRSDIDLVVLGVPNFAHRELVIACAKAGKHVVCTKPLARNSVEAKDMLDAVRSAGVLHGYAETEVFSPAVMRARAFIERGGIGDVLTVRSREAHGGPHEPWFWNKELSGGGALLDMGCHTIEAARYFVGKDNPIVEVMAWGATMVHHDRTQAEDNAVLMMRFEGGQMAQSELSWSARGGLDLRNEVYGTAGALFTDITRETPLKVFSQPGAGYVVEKADTETGWLFPPVDEAWTYGYREEMRHFVECVRTNTMPRETFEDGWIVNRVIDAAYLSMSSKRWEPVS